VVCENPASAPDLLGDGTLREKQPRPAGARRL